MKVFKSLSLFLALFLLGTSISFAQSQTDNVTDEQRAELQQAMEELVTALALTEEQKPEFVAISRSYAEQMIEVRDSDQGQFKKYRRIKSLMQDRNAEMEDLLSDEQYDIYLEKQEEMQQRRKEMRSENQ